MLQQTWISYVLAAFLLNIWELGRDIGGVARTNWSVIKNKRERTKWGHVSQTKKYTPAPCVNLDSF